MATQGVSPSVPDTSYLGLIRAQPMLIPLLVIMAFVMSGMGVVTPVLSIYAQSFGVSATLIGLTITAFGVARLFVNLPAGELSERYGRKLLLCLGPLIICIGSVGAAMAPSFWSLVFWRFVQGVGSGMYMTVAFAAAADLSAPANRGQVMALNQTALLGGASLGPLLGGVLADLFDHRAPFWGFAIVAFVGFLVALLALRETRPASGGRRAESGKGGSLPALLTDRRFMAVTLVSFGTFFTRTAAQWYLIPLVGHERLGLSLSFIGGALTAHTVANVAMLPVAGRLIDRFGQRSCILVSTALVALSLVLVGIAGAIWLYLAGLMLLGLSLGVSNPGTAAYATDHAPAGRFGPAMGMLRTMGDLGFVLGPLVMGFVVDLGGGYGRALVVNSVLVLATVLAFALTSARRKGPAAQPSSIS
jgi:MFS transporter, DHA1 family, multidrug resistance protein